MLKFVNMFNKGETVSFRLLLGDSVPFVCERIKILSQFTERTVFMFFTCKRIPISKVKEM